MTPEDAEVAAVRQAIADALENYVVGIHGTTSAVISEREAMVLAVVALRAIAAENYAVVKVSEGVEVEHQDEDEALTPDEAAFFRYVASTMRRLGGKSK